jgi:GNAT superfamily N-acetyltransferase
MIKLRNARLEDMSAILNLVRELAVYEREPEAVTATLEDYEKNFSDGVFQAILAENEENIVVGMAVFYVAWSTWRGRMMYLEDFYVMESERKSGIGQQLFDAFLEESRRQNCVLTKWQVLDWNEPGLKFYEKNKAIIEKEWWNGKIFLKNIM